jgi:biopolymer transport protein ExbB
MKKALFLIFFCMMAIAWLIGGSDAQEIDGVLPLDTVKSLDELLQVVKDERARASNVNSNREQTFLKKRDSRQELLKETKEQLKRKNKDTIQLTRRMEENEKEIQSLRRALENQAGNLNELHGVLRQYAGDLNAMLRESLTSAQHRPPAVVLERLSQSDEFPSLQDIQKLWAAFQHEMTESGKIAQFRAGVITPQGVSENKTVTRIGVFTAIAEGKFLEYSSDIGALSQLTRQPESRFLKYAKSFENANNAILPMVVDPTKGRILSLISQKPNLFERISQGGLVGAVIIGIGSVGVLIALYRLLTLSWTGKKIRQQLTDLENPSHKNPLGRVLSVFGSNVHVDMETLELSLDEAILKEIPRIEWGQAILKLLAVIAPLLGLLGTVIGMIVTFQAITLFGTGDPKLMADGISQALVTTALGLVVAVPLLLFHGLVASKAKGIVQILDQQCAGLVAGLIEEKGAAANV